jgi:ribosomal protein S18 acetylase RimI-like enzyme
MIRFSGSERVSTMNYLPQTWTTARCVLLEAGEEALETIIGILVANQETLALLFPEVSPEALAQGLIRRQAIPPGGDPDRLKTFLITDLEAVHQFGYLSVYCGYPREDILYVGDLFLHPDWQGQTFGQEVALSLEQVAAANGFREIRLAVGLKNWLALRFWVRLGYTQITKLSGERNFKADAFANLELCKSL